MERNDLPTLRALGFDDEELQRLGLWDIPTGDPADMAEAYIRRSKKKDTLSALREHLRDICRKAREEGKQIRHVWFEQRSASKAHVRREEFENATSAVLAGGSKTLYVWRTDRLSRRGIGAVARLLEEFTRKGARVVVTAEGLDSSQPGMKIVFSILADRAEEEAKAIAQRTKIGGDAHKREGRWPGGVTPYGLICPKGKGKLVHAPDEYKHARRIANLLLAGKTPAEIANTFNSEKIRTRKGKMWRAQTIIHLAHSPSWAGLIPIRERAVDEDGQPLDKWHRGGEPLTDENGHPVSAGEGVVTFAEWKKIEALISGRSRPGSAIGDRTRGVRKAVTILSGILRCPHCGGPMGNGGRNYNCRNRAVQGESVCPGAATERNRLDAAVSAMWMNHILALTPESPTIHEIARRWLNYQDPEKEARKRKVTAALDSAIGREMKLKKEFFVMERMTEEDYEQLRGQLEARIAALKAELAELNKEADLSPLMDGESLALIWDGAGVDGRRALLKAALTSLTIIPAKHKGDRTPIIKRLVPDWRDKENIRNAEIDAFFNLLERQRESDTAESS